MDWIAAAVRRNRRSLLLIALGSLCLLLHGVVFAQLDTSVPMSSFEDPLNIDFSQLQEQTDTWTRIMGVSTLLPMLGQALLIAGLLGWVLKQSQSSDRD
ncbi:hypothetical protein [Streptomyces himalayensis]|uniref:Uncharacterized protein n=1 Tax=Streptomyces himalayensis subsp. himalayensis TaxID=2756131 RepID=A0A7W0DH22_9ACTN|nr:hypothetical protein [Streptomyces himalayensis]MBA2944917.1 hypothetical protein [Streptomyces himalayensis subsp. himalayensis]